LLRLDILNKTLQDKLRESEDNSRKQDEEILDFKDKLAASKKNNAKLKARNQK
jgi:hypothetical protein